MNNISYFVVVELKLQNPKICYRRSKVEFETRIIFIFCWIKTKNPKICYRRSIVGSTNLKPAAAIMADLKFPPLARWRYIPDNIDVGWLMAACSWSPLHFSWFTFSRQNWMPSTQLSSPRNEMNRDVARESLSLTVPGAAATYASSGLELYCWVKIIGVKIIKTVNIVKIVNR